MSPSQPPGVQLSLLLFGLFGLVSVACAEDAVQDDGIPAETARALEGVYSLQTFTRNDVGCNDPGQSVLNELQDELFVLASFETLGERFMVLASCTDADECLATSTAAKRGEGYTYEFGYLLSRAANDTTLTGFSATSGAEDRGLCRGREYQTHQLVDRQNGGVSFESRSVRLPDAPPEDGFCVAEPAADQQEASGLPCGRLESLLGVKI